MSAAKGSDRWLWAAALALLVLGALSVAGAVAGYFFWWLPRQERVKAGQVAAAPEAPSLEPTPTARATTEPVPAGESDAPAAPGPGAGVPHKPAPRPRGAGATATPTPAQRPASDNRERSAEPSGGDLRGSLTLDVEAVQDHLAADAVDSMRFEVRLGDRTIGTVDVRFGARGVARQNGSGRAELSKLPLGDHTLHLLGGPARGGTIHGEKKVHFEAGARLRLMTRVRYMSATDREVRFR